MKAQARIKVCPFMSENRATACLAMGCQLWDSKAQTCSLKVLVRLLRKAEK